MPITIVHYAKADPVVFAFLYYKKNIARTIIALPVTMALSLFVNSLLCKSSENISEYYSLCDWFQLFSLSPAIFPVVRGNFQI